MRLKDHVEALLTALAFVFLRRFGLIAPTPIWILLTLIAGGVLLRAVGDHFWPPDGDAAQLQLRIATGTIASALVMYATGWGPVLAVGYMFTAGVNIKGSGSRAAKPAIVWAIVASALGQAAVAMGLAPTLITQPLVHGLAGLSLLGAVFAIRLVGQSTAERETAEQEVAAALQREQRVSTDLRRLNDAIKVVASSMDMREMLDAITSSINDALEGKFAAILFRGPDALMTGSLRGRIPPRPGMIHLPIEAIAEESACPSSMALHTGKPVVVQDFLTATDPKIAKWAPDAASVGVRSMVAMPLGVPAMAVLNVYFAQPNSIKDDDLRLLSAFAEEATVAIARADAYDRERDAVRRLHELDEMKDEFISTVSHELRTPLTTIEGFADTLRRRWDGLTDEVRQDFVGRIGRNSAEMRTLIEDLLEMSRLERQDYELKTRVLPVAEQVASCLHSLADLFAGRLIEVNVESGLAMQADPRSFDRVLDNVLTNVAKYSPAGSPVLITAMRQGFDIVISVTDQGAGIPLDEQARIFERFYQGSGRKPGRSGTGIGLNIARRYIEMQGGRIWVESEPGKGSTFSFTIPSAHSTRTPPRPKVTTKT
ncbi:MAG: ATP-binding protein [Actinomycetota bacterium]|nr:GAF domain-containing protein [Actinomycetota bacterium]